MGLDLTYQALPPECPALRRAIRDPEYWERFSLIVPASDSMDNGFYKKVVGEDSESRELYAEFSDIRNFQFSLDRHYAGLSYLLNPPSATEEEDRFPTYESRIVFGNSEMPDHAVGVQGIRVRYSDQAFVEEANAHISRIEIDSLEENFDPVKMAELGLYKCFDSDEFAPYREIFRDFQNYLEQVADRRLDLLVFVD